MIQGSKQWTNDYGAYLIGDDNDLKTKTSLILQSQESQQVKVKVNLMVKGQQRQSPTGLFKVWTKP